TLKLAATQYPDQLQITPSGGNRYVAMNTSKPPFNNIDVRKAVLAGSNRDQLRATRGGPLTGTIATHFIPPNVPGFHEAGGTARPNPHFLQKPNRGMRPAAADIKKGRVLSGECGGSKCGNSKGHDHPPPRHHTPHHV